MSTAAPYASVAPSLTSVLPQYVHKTDPAEVLLTGWGRTGEDSYTVTARWPRGHGFYTPTGGLPDPLLVAETIRQTIPLLSHCAYDAPMNHRQSWSDFGYTLDGAAYASAAELAAEDTEDAVELRITCTDVVRRGGRLCSMTMRVDILLAGVTVGMARTTFGNHSRAIYQRLRGAYADLERSIGQALAPAAPIAAARVGRAYLHDVVLSATDDPNRMRLRVDLGHPVLFDHPVDHVPGMLMLEAARQAALAMAYPQTMLLVGIDCQFTRYGELDAPCWLQAEPLPADTAGQVRLLLSAVQNGVCIFATTATLEPVRGN